MAAAFTKGPMTKPLAWIAAAALLTGLLYFLHFRDFFYPDSASYIASAENLLARHGFTAADGEPETFRTPGYPVLILPFLWGHLDLKYLVLLQQVVRVLMILAATVFAYRFSGDRRLSVLAAMLLVIDFPLLEAANAVLTDLSFTAALMAVYWLLWNAAEAERPSAAGLLTAGLVAGAAALIRPIGIFFFVPAAVYLVLARRDFRLRAALLFVLAFACLPLAWASRNQRAIGHFTISTISGFSALQYRAAGALAIERPGDFRVNVEQAQKQLEERACQEMRRLYSRECSQMTVAQKSEYYARLGREVVLQHPAAYIKVALRGAAVMMLDGGPATLTGIAGTSWPVGMRLLMIYTLPVLGFAMYGTGKCWGMNRGFFWLALLVMAYFILVSAGPESYSRFRVPFLPFYAILAATGMQAAWKRVF